MKARLVWIGVFVFLMTIVVLATRSTAATPPGQGPAGLGDVTAADTVPSTISYQGRLTDAAGNPLSGNYDLVFQLWNAAAGGRKWGTAITKPGVPIGNGIFTVDLDVPQFNGQAYWIEIQVNGQTLAPRQQLLPVPYALALMPGAVISGTEEWILGVANFAARGQYGSPHMAGIFWDDYGIGIWANSQVGTAISATTRAGTAVYAEAPSGAAIKARSGGGEAVDAETTSAGRAIKAVASGGDAWHPSWAGYFQGMGQYDTALDARSGGDYGYAVKATSGGRYGHAVYARADAFGGIAVYGGTNAESGKAVYGQSTDSTGVGGYFEGQTAAVFQGKVQVRAYSSNNLVMELGEGLDYSEGFEVSVPEEIQAGAVLVIDADNPGNLTLSTEPYDTKVAGIVSGANGLGSAIRVGEYDHAVALAGRVYCNVDATEAAVEPGDLLTTSGTPGYAMKVLDYGRAQGAILGKAMERLPQGQQGQILVLVTLQ